MYEDTEKPSPPESGDSTSRNTAQFVDVLMREAYDAMSKQEYESASRIFNDILRRFDVALEHRQKSVIHSELGTLFYWLGDYDSAEHHSEQALAYGDNDQAFIILGKIAVAKFQFPRSRGYFSKVSQSNPARSLGFCLIALKLRDTIGAESFLTEAKEKHVNPKDPEYLVYKSYLQLLKGDSKAAVFNARDQIVACEHDPGLLNCIAEIFMMAGNYGEAVSLAKRVQKFCPKNDHPHSVLAHAAYADENFADAGRHAEEAVRLNPLNAYAKTVQMKLACRNGHYSLAEKIGTDILRDSPEYSLGHANLGDVYFNQGRYEMAEIEYSQTMQLMNADTKGARLRQARMKYIKSDFFEAAKILEQLITSYHTYFDDAMCDLALCYDAMEDEEKKDQILDKMALRKDFYHRTEQLLQQLA